VEFARFEAQQRAVQQRIGRFRASDRLSRDDLHREAALSEDLSDTVDYAGVRVENPFSDG